MAGFEEHREHLAPQCGGLNGLEYFDFTARSFGFAFNVARLEGTTEQIMQVRRVGGRKQRPWTVFHDAFHEQIRNPVCRVHVVRTTAIITCVLTQFEELFNVKVPRFEVRADSAFALAALVHRDSRVVHHFEERHDTLGFAVGSFDVRTHGAHGRPVVA